MKTEKQRVKRKKKAKEERRRFFEQNVASRQFAKKYRKEAKLERQKRNELERQKRNKPERTTFLAQAAKLTQELRKRMKIPEDVEYSLKELWAMAQNKKVDIRDLIKKNNG